MTINQAYTAIILACLVAIVLIVAFAPHVEAAPNVPPCEAINSAGNITVFYCEPVYGAPYKINSLGFMLNED